MVMHVKTFLVIAIVIGGIKSEQRTSLPEDVADVTTTEFTPTTQNLKLQEETSTVKYSDTTWGERLRKPFLYGRKFELANKEKKTGNGELYSPIITSPILTLPYDNANLGPGSQTKPEILKQNQNEIFTSIQDFLKESTEGTFNKTYFAEEVNESENHGGEATTENSRREDSEEVNGSASRSRQDGERSLLVVLPFKADEDNVEELFTKSPMVKVIENDQLDKELKPEGTSLPPVIREIIPTTSKSVTRKRWRPTKRHRITTEPPTPETTTENGEDVTKTYTNYNDVEMVTKKYQPSTQEPEKFTNHKYEAEFTPYPVFKRFKVKKPVTKEATTTESLQLVDVNNEKPKETKPKRKGLRRKSTTEGPPKPEELSKVLDILPPDMKDLILHIGLNKDNKDQRVSEDNFRLERPPQPTIDPKSYAVFKPLPLKTKDENRNFVPDDMKDFLASFGLLTGERRGEKSLKDNKDNTTSSKCNTTEHARTAEAMSLDFLPDDLKSILSDMGFVKEDEKKEPTRIHIFNPSNHTIARNEEDREKLNAILSSIKTAVNESQSLTPEMQSEVIEKIRDLNSLRYKNRNLTEINNEIQKIVVNKSGDKKPRTTRRAKKLNEGPDPLMFVEESLLKNDVKRQDSSSASSSASSSSSSSALASGDATASSDAAVSSEAIASSDVSASASGATAETTTEEGPNIEALKESFGGGETASDDADIESSLPPKRPNGLYLLLDWNSFLEVGTDDDNRRVNLRFQPKIGDSRNFLSVTVP